MTSRPGIRPGEDRKTGLGDINFTAFLSPADAGKIIWGIGPVMVSPTATNDGRSIGSLITSHSVAEAGYSTESEVGGLVSSEAPLPDLLRIVTGTRRGNDSVRREISRVRTPLLIKVGRANGSVGAGVSSMFCGACSSWHFTPHT